MMWKAERVLCISILVFPQMEDVVQGTRSPITILARPLADA